jgi:DNA processing protein
LNEAFKVILRGTWDNSLFTKTLAIVGSRRVTSYGERGLDMLIPNLVAEGVTIISGFMYGVDTLAHQKTLECGAKPLPF